MSCGVSCLHCSRLLFFETQPNPTPPTNHNQRQDNAVLIEPLKATLSLALKLIKSSLTIRHEFNCHLMKVILAWAFYLFYSNYK